MYSRYYPQRPAGEVRLPENYNGCAFQKSPPQKKEPIGYLEVAKPTPMQEEARNQPQALPSAKAPFAAQIPPTEPTEEHPSQKAEESVPTSSLPELLGHAFPFLSPKKMQSLFSGGVDFDRILLLSLILLLWGNEDNTELILCLGLLLFCG